MVSFIIKDGSAILVKEMVLKIEGTFYFLSLGKEAFL